MLGFMLLRRLAADNLVEVALLAMRSVLLIEEGEIIFVEFFKPFDTSIF